MDEIITDVDLTLVKRFAKRKKLEGVFKPQAALDALDGLAELETGWKYPGSWVERLCVLFAIISAVLIYNVPVAGWLFLTVFLVAWGLSRFAPGIPKEVALVCRSVRATLAKLEKDLAPNTGVALSIDLKRMPRSPKILLKEEKALRTKWKKEERTLYEIGLRLNGLGTARCISSEVLVRRFRTKKGRSGKTKTKTKDAYSYRTRIQLSASCKKWAIHPGASKLKNVQAIESEGKCCVKVKQVCAKLPVASLDACGQDLVKGLAAGLKSLVPVPKEGAA